MTDKKDPGFDEITAVGFRPSPVAAPASPKRAVTPEPALTPPSAPSRPTTSGSDPRRQRVSALGLGAATNGSTGERPPQPAADRIAPRLPADRKDNRLSGSSLSDISNGPEDALIAAAIQPLVIVAQIRDAVEVSDIAAFRREVSDTVQKFDDLALKLGAPAADIGAARYVLCSLIDETVMTTTWGEASNWSANSLLNQFHGETWGGEKVFDILEQARSSPSQHLALLKLVDLALLLGFEGLYRVRDNGRDLLDALRNDLGRTIISLSRTSESELSATWRGIEAVRKRLRRYVPVWVVFAVTGFVLVAFYGIQQFRLYGALESVTRQLDRVGTQRL